MRVLIISLAILFSYAPVCWSQADVQISIPENFNPRTGSFQILGKYQNQLLVTHGFGKKYRLISYDGQMQQNWRRELNAEVDWDRMEALLLHNDGLSIFHVTKGKNHYYLKTQVLDIDEWKWGQKKMVDSTEKSFADGFPTYRFKLSNKRNRILVQNTSFEYSKLENVRNICLDTKGQTLWKRNKLPEIGESDFKLHSQNFGDNGELFTVYKLADQHWNANREAKIFIDFFDGQQSWTKKISWDAKLPNNMRYELDEVNQRWRGFGFFGPKQKQRLDGTFVISGTFANPEYQIQFKNFDSSLVKRVYNPRAKRSNWTNLHSFYVEDLIMTNDGSLIAVCEQIYENLLGSDRSAFNFDPTASRGVGDYERQYYFNDLYAVFIDSAGDYKWEEIMKKRQVSTNDIGYRSSYSLFMDADHLKLLFHEDISQLSSLMAYSLFINGSSELDAIFRASEKNLYLIPKRAKQISASELIIPSIYKGQLTFVKLNF